MRYSHVTSARTSRVVAGPDRGPEPGHVLVRTVVSGVCASELPAWSGHHGGEPQRLGHELSGEIAALGSGVYGWSVGDPVTGFASGAFAETVQVPAASLRPVPPNAPVWSVLGEPVACVLEALSRCGLEAGRRVAVVGLGFMGMIAVQAVAARAPSLLVGVDPKASARELASSLGAHEVRAPEEAEDRSFDVVIELTGSAGGLERAGQLVTTHGQLCIAGYHHSGPRELDVELWYRGVTIVNGFSPQRHRQLAALDEGLALIATRQLTLEPLITHQVALDDLDIGFGLLEHRPPGFVKCVVRTDR
jgi:threonine dehydrogenase-like Zn-dependent dehydrogenase